MAAVGDPTKGYYSYNAGTWHLIALNARCKIVACNRNSTQERWLLRDLQDHPNICKLVYWHQPRFSSANGGGTSKVSAFWTDIYNHAVDGSHAVVCL